MVKSKRLYNYLESLNQINHHQVELIWDPGYKEIDGNEKAVEGVCNAVKILFYVVTLPIIGHLEKF